MKNADLIKEFEEKFSKLKDEIRFDANIEDVDRIFFIKDHILREGFVSENLSRQICGRIAELYLAWNNYLHSLIMPNPQNMLNMGESKIFNSEEKKEITELMKRAMEISSRNSLLGLVKSDDEIAEFIDYSVSFWNDIFCDKLTAMMRKINKEWKEE